ncbi:MAG TPA: hypothetical protein PLE30_10675 [Candidatus Kapabacteria bacterium]|nr:hypothetical protein [Candidatus Kapabacteria bacterium]
MKITIIVVAIFILSIEYLYPQQSDCLLNKGYWTPDLELSPQMAIVKYDNINYSLFYRYRIGGMENKLSLESIEFEDTIRTDLSKNLREFMNNLVIELINSQAIKFSWSYIEDENKSMDIELVRKVNWKHIIGLKSNNLVKQTLIACPTNVCFYSYIDIKQNKEGATLGFKEYDIDPELRNEEFKNSLDSNCISILK